MPQAELGAHLSSVSVKPKTWPHWSYCMLACHSQEQHLDRPPLVRKAQRATHLPLERQPGFGLQSLHFYKIQSVLFARHTFADYHNRPTDSAHICYIDRFLLVAILCPFINSTWPLCVIIIHSPLTGWMTKPWHLQTSRQTVTSKSLLKQLLIWLIVRISHDVRCGRR